jgi:hypothetical protein
MREIPTNCNNSGESLRVTQSNPPSHRSSTAKASQENSLAGN